MEIAESKISYFSEGIECKGFVARPQSSRKAPCVLVAHAWMGQDSFAREKARELARLGFVGFAIDVYGNGTTATTSDKALELMLPLFLDRASLQKRVLAAFEFAKTLDGVDASKIGAIGFCFGGQTVLELLRSGAAVKGVVSFHGVLGNALNGKAAVLSKPKAMQGAALVLHGHDDPLVSHDDLVQLQKEFTKASIDWQLHIFGRTKHAFTNPEANDAAMGLVYDEKAHMRSWQLMKDFLKEVFDEI